MDYQIQNNNSKKKKLKKQIKMNQTKNNDNDSKIKLTYSNDFEESEVIDLRSNNEEIVEIKDDVDMFCMKQPSLLEKDFISFESTKIVTNNLQQINKKGVFIPWMSERTMSYQGYKKLHFELLDFYNFMSPTVEENLSRERTIKFFKDKILERWPNFKVKKFGSFSNGLHLPESDVDIVVVDKTNSYSQERILKGIIKILSAYEKDLNYLKYIDAKVPIIRAELKQTKIMVDISSNRKNGYVAKKVIKRILACYPYMRPLIYFLKYFLKQSHLNEAFTGGISSFLLFNLLLSFIQNFRKTNKDDFNLGTLLYEFFDFYGFKFNYDEIGISVKYGGVFYKKMDRSWLDSRRNYLLSLENFQDPEQDIGKGSFKINSVKALFKTARDNLLYPSEYPLYSYLNLMIKVDPALVERYKKLKE